MEGVKGKNGETEQGSKREMKITGVMRDRWRCVMDGEKGERSDIVFR